MKAECYSRPFFSLTHGEAIRTFTDAVNTEDSPYNRHPADYTLFHVGSFDDSLGALTPAEAVVNLGNAQSYLVVEQLPLTRTA